MSDPFDSPRLTDLKLIETQEPDSRAENNSMDSKDKKENSCEEPLSQSTASQDGNQPPSQKNPSHLKLVISNPPPDQQNLPSSQPPLSDPQEFTAEVRNKSPHLYEMHIQDSSLELTCALMLQIGEWEREDAVVCHFPDFLTDLNRLLDEDETLYAMLMVQFQMRVLEQLFIFCIDHNATQLFIYMDDDQAEGFGAYHDFLERQIETLTANGEKTEMAIPINRKASVRLRKTMNKTTIAFEKDLWREQRFNPVIRSYLKTHVRKKTITQA